MASPGTARDLLERALRIGEAHPFTAACLLAGMEPSMREAARWRRGGGRALAAAWSALALGAGWAILTVVALGAVALAVLLLVGSGL